MGSVECLACRIGYPLEYHPGYGWYHFNPSGGPEIECINPVIIDMPKPEDTEE